MKRWGVILSAVVVFALLLAGAVAWECARYIRAAAENMRAAEAPVLGFEQRYVSNLPGPLRDAPPVHEALESYRQAEGPTDRYRAFDELVAKSREAWSGVDPTDPVLRAAADEMAGSLNRRRIALDDLRPATAAYDQAAATVRGRIGRLVTGLPDRWRP